MPSLSAARESRLSALGATVPAAAESLHELLAAVAFPGPEPAFIFGEWADYAEASVFDALRAQPGRAAEFVRDPELVWDICPFTPFTPGTPGELLATLLTRQEFEASVREALAED